MMEGMQGHMGEGSGMIQNMDQMAGLMREITRVMQGHSDDASMKKMSGILKDMSKIINDGDISQKEMNIMNKKILQTQKGFEMM